MQRLLTIVAAVAVAAGLLAASGTSGPLDRGGRAPGELGSQVGGTGRLPNFAARGGTVIRLLAGKFDPRHGSLPAPRGIGFVDAAKLPAGRAQYWLVQALDERFAEVIRAVGEAGGTVVGTVPEDTYMVRATPAQRAAIARDRAVRWTGYYQPAWRVAAGAAGKPGLLELAGERTYRVYAFQSDPNAPALAGALAAIHGVEVVADSGVVVDVRATAAQVQAIASLPSVEWVGVKPDVVPLNANARWVNDTGVRDVYAATAAGRLTGAGQTAGVADTGLNYTYDLNGRAHVAFRDCNADGSGCKTAVYTQMTPGTALANMATIRNNATGHRKMVAYFDLGDTGPNMFDESSHGSHTSGSVDGDQPPYGQYTGNDGLAPAAMHVHQNIASSSGGLVLPSDSYDLWRQAYRPRDPASVATTSGANGNPGDYVAPGYRPLEDARTHNNSYGTLAPIVDTGQAIRLDRFVWDHEDMTIVVSAGNGGPDAGSISSPSVAKNNLSSGASANGRQPMASIDSLASFSSHGPTGDGRLGPDLATPGQVVVSVKGGSTDGYHVAQGTSMSGPVLTGLATLVRQYFFDGYAAAGGDGFAAGRPSPGRRHNPSAALVKAALINGAIRMRGFYTGDDGGVRALDGQWPSAGQGFGRVNLDNSLYFANDPTNNWYADVYRGDTANADASLRPFAVASLPATRTFTLRVAPGQPFDATLAWTDAPNLAPAGTPALVNNLDLTVTGPGGTYVGNNMNSRTNPAVDVAETLALPGLPDLVNNAERVRIANPPAGLYTITVAAAAIMTGNQGFALAASGNISPATGALFQPGPALQHDEPGTPAISNVRIDTISADTAKIYFSTSEPTTATAELPIAGTPTTFVDSYNAGPDGFPGLDAGPVETSAEYANKPMVGREHEILVTGLTPGQEAVVTLRARDLAATAHEKTQTATLRSPATVFQADAPDIAQLYEDPQSATASLWRTGTQMYASDSGAGDGALGAFGFRIPDAAVDPAAVDAAVVELRSSHNWVVPYTSDPLYDVDLLDASVEPAWGTGLQTYDDIKSAARAARFYPETTYKRGAYERYAFTLRCSDLPALRATLSGAGEQLAAFRWESSVDPVPGLLAMEFGFNRRSRGPELRPKLVLFTAGQSGYPDGRPCDPTAPAPAISEVGIHAGGSDDAVTVTWETDLPSDSMVIFREQGATEWTQVATPALTTIHQVEVFGLDPFVDYEFAVRSAVCNGNASTDTNGGAGYDFFFSVDLGSPTTVASYDFESDAQGWTTAATTTNDAGVASPWVRRGSGADGTATGWHVALDGGPVDSYGDLSESTLTSPPAAFPGATAAVRFYLARDLEETFDFLHVEYSADGGASWTDVEQIDGTNDEYPGYEAVAREVQFVNPNPGGQIQVRFRFVSDDLVSSPLYLGASLDEVSLRSYPNAPGGGGGGENLPLTGPVPPPSAGASGLTPPPTRSGPASAADVAAGTGYCTIPGAGQPPVDEGDKATGGGWLADASGEKINFGFNVRRSSSGGTAGELQLQDKARSVKIKLTRATSLQEGPWGANSLVFEGAGTYNGASASFRVTVQDNGEGKSASPDRFLLECLSGCDGYTTGREGADDEIDGGNIQVHRAGQAPASGEAEPTTLTLDPLLMSEAAVGVPQSFTVRVYDQNQRPLANTTVTLTRLTAGGAVVSVTAPTGLTGSATIPMVTLAEPAEYRASAGSAESNTVELAPIRG